MIYYAEVECFLYQEQSLKEKRSLMKRLIHKLRQQMNVSVAELDYHDLWQRTKLGIVTISNEAVHAEQIIQEALRLIDSFSDLERTLTHIERL
ncbi:MAG TPA: DUF503 domain-containing protein [Bacillota bacterium]|nr:DUF503 domain-containing protein [Bacillota bacterium]